MRASSWAHDLTDRDFEEDRGIGREKMHLFEDRDEEVEGAYLKMNISSKNMQPEVHMYHENHFSVEIFVYVTNKPIDPFGTAGFIGIGICPPELREDYSFRHHLAKEIARKTTKDLEDKAEAAKLIDDAKISSLEWVVESAGANEGGPVEPNGFLYVNHGAVQANRTDMIGTRNKEGLKALNDVPINSFAEIHQWNLKFDTSEPPIITSSPVMQTSFKLGSIFTQSSLK